MDKGTGIYNGDIGIIREINLFAELVTVEFDEGRMVEYSFKQMEELELAYAITIHKSQGSEYPAVVIPIFSGPKMLMTRNLIYTAVTRARIMRWSRDGIRGLGRGFVRFIRWSSGSDRRLVTEQKEEAIQLYRFSLCSGTGWYFFLYS